MIEQTLREQISAVSRLLWERGWVANHDGNVTARLEDGRILATPTAVSKRSISPDHVLVLSPEGKLLENQRLPGKPFSEINLHLVCYRERADVKAVIHAHPPTASGFSVAGVGVIAPILAEAIVSLGPGAPIIPYQRPGSPEQESALAKALVEADAALLANHGPITVGTDLEQAFLRMELVEHLAKIQLVARQLGRVNALPHEDVAFLHERRAAAGLGPAARGITVPPPEAPPAERAPEPPPVSPASPAAAVAPIDAIERAVREELARLGLR